MRSPTPSSARSRVRGGGVAEFISLGRKRATTTLEFALQGEQYRVTRTASRGKKSVETKAVLERRRSGDFYETIAEGVSRVDALLAEKLHMTCDVFTQAVVLPQGQFATFLKSAPRDRRQMLNELLQLQVFERMHKQASARKAELETQLDGLTRRIEEDFAGVSQENLEPPARRAAPPRRAASKSAQTSLAEKRVELDEMRRRLALDRERAAVQQTLRGLVAREPERAAQAETLRRAREARRCAPMLDEADRDRTAAGALETETRRLSKAFDAARDRYVAVLAERETADDAAENVPALETRRLRLAEIAGKVELRRTLQSNRNETAGGLARKRAKDAELTKTLAGFDEQQRTGRRDLAALIQERRPLPDDVDGRLMRGRELATRLGQVRLDFERLGKEQARLESEGAAARTTVETATDKRDDSDAKLKQAEQAHARALAERDRRRHSSLVDELRRELRAGGACPVCRQEVEHPPGCTALAAPAEDEVAKFERRVTKLRSEASRAAAEALVAETERDRLTALAAEVVGQVDRERAQVAVLEADLNEVMPTPSTNGSVEKSFLAWSEEVRQTRERLERIDHDEAILSEKLTGIDRSRTATQAALAEIEVEIRDGERQLADVEPLAGVG